MSSQPTEIIEVEQDSAACDGGGGPLGHPKVYLALDRNGAIDCPYCGRRYVRKPAAAAARNRLP
jgi:uncharacterized Zn-finger protein